jgi:hypothetical protein
MLFGNPREAFDSRPVNALLRQLVSHIRPTSGFENQYDVSTGELAVLSFAT